MNSIKLMGIIVVFSIGAVVNGNLITLDGECPFADIKPVVVDAAALLDAAKIVTGKTSMKFNLLAETAPLSGSNRTDLVAFLEHTQLPDAKVGVTKFTKHFRSTETGQCGQFDVILKPTSELGVYDVLYQVAPNTNFVNYKGMFLSMNPLTLTTIGFVCHNLPNNQYQFEIAVFSASTAEYNRATKKEVEGILEFNNLGELTQYVRDIEHKKKCV